MKNKDFLRNYSHEVLNLFKVHYKKLITQNIDLKYSKILNETMNELGIAEYKLEEIEFLSDWFNTVHNQLFISDILNCGDAHEIIFHSSTNVQKIYFSQKEIKTISNLNAEDYQLSFEVFALKNNIAWNFSNPFASFTAKINNSEFRATLIHFSTSANNVSKIFLRALQTTNPKISLFNEDQKLVNLLTSLVKEKKNMLISGSTGSGKTTFLRALLGEISQDEHTVVLEDTHEILTFSPNQTSFLAQDSVLKKSLKDYCAYALRMSPDRLIVGEMRSTEVVPFLLAMNTGHTGLMSTIHANSCVDSLSRIALLFSLYSENKEIDFSLITKLVCRNIDYVIHMENKKIKEICRVIGSEGTTPFYEMIYQIEEPGPALNFVRTS
jgi:type IV secretion system protein VirB11